MIAEPKAPWKVREDLLHTTTSSFAVRWDYDPTSVVTGWLVQYRERRHWRWLDDEQLIETSTDRFAVLNLKDAAGKTYVVRVIALSRHRRSEPSNTIRVTLSKYPCRCRPTVLVQTQILQDHTQTRNAGHSGPTSLMEVSIQARIKNKEKGTQRWIKDFSQGLVSDHHSRDGGGRVGGTNPA